VTIVVEPKCSIDAAANTDDRSHADSAGCFMRPLLAPSRE